LRSKHSADGPYDWVSPNYWYGDQLGAAFGFGSELGAGVGTPELSSLKKFLTASDMKDLWTAPNKGLYHMSTDVSQFFDRSIYNQALYARYGKPTSLDDYLLKAQAMDYEATRAEYEAYSAKQNAARPATGVIYWMMNNAWPSLHWNLFDFYLKGAGSYYGSKVGSRPEHVAFEYGSKSGNIWLINHTLNKTGARSIAIDLLSTDGKTMVSKTIKATTKATTSQLVGTIPEATTLKNVAFLRLVLTDSTGATLSRNVYWISPILDVNDWGNSTWYNTPVTTFADYTALQSLSAAKLSASAGAPVVNGSCVTVPVELENQAKVPAYFIRLELQDASGADITPAMWTDNYVTLWPGEKLSVGVHWEMADAHGAGNIQISGGNVGTVGSLAFKW
jgi:exo-1,4-beta-D-glucosaminidase